MQRLVEQAELGIRHKAYGMCKWMAGHYIRYTSRLKKEYRNITNFSSPFSLVPWNSLILSRKSKQRTDGQENVFQAQSSKKKVICLVVGKSSLTEFRPWCAVVDVSRPFASSALCSQITVIPIPPGVFEPTLSTGIAYTPDVA